MAANGIILPSENKALFATIKIKCTLGIKMQYKSANTSCFPEACACFFSFHKKYNLCAHFLIRATSELIDRRDY